jgi:hypothetical protein
MLEVLDDLADLPTGAHAVALYAGRDEAAEQAVEFLAGAPEGQAASFWVANPSLVPFYAEKLEARAPAQVGCVHVLDHEQVRPVDGKLRPTDEVLAFLASHPEGVTGGGDTITQYWAPSNIPDHLEYEAWFDAQPRGPSRFLCPYDLRRVPAKEAPRVLRELGRRHSHAVLSRSNEPAVRLLQLFVFGSTESVPPRLAGNASWAQTEALIELDGSTNEIRLTSKGEGVVEAWMSRPLLDP